jgi:hypothetical protein
VTTEAEYEIVANSRGARREFKITVGLREGYDPEGRVYDLSEATKIALRWMTERAGAGKPFLSGMFTRGEVAYAWPRADGSVGRDREPVAIFTGEAIPLYAGSLADVEIEAMLNELAALLGKALRQERIYIAYRDHTWIVKRKGSPD